MSVLLALSLVAVPAAPVTRSEVLERAAEYVSHQWEMTKANKTVDCTSNSYASDYDVGTQTGVPYAWGGWQTVEQFDKRLGDGQGAGSHSKDGVLSCVAGVDCSGYVSQAWGTSQKYGTSTLSQVSTEVDIEDIKPGDAFNKAGSHVVLFTGYNDAGEPMFYEASGGASRVRAHSGWSYLNGYTPIRFNDIVDDEGDGVADGDVEAGLGVAADVDQPEEGGGENQPEVGGEEERGEAVPQTASASGSSGGDSKGKSGKGCGRRKAKSASLGFAFLLAGGGLLRRRRE